MRHHIRRTRLRLALAYTLTFGAVLLAVMVALWTVVSTAALSAVDDRLQVQLGPVRDAIAHRFAATPAGEHLDRSANLPGTAADGTPIDAMYVAYDGVVASSPGAPRDRTVVAAAHDRDGLHSADVHGSVRTLVAAFSDGQGTDGVIVLTTSLTQYESDRVWLAAGLAVTVVLLMAAAGGLGYAIAGAALRPVRRIATTARDLSENDLHRRIDLDLPDDELGELGSTFNGMLERLEHSFEALRHFSADAAHELRTPLTLMRTEAEVTLSRPRSGAEYRTSLEGILGDVEHLSRLVERLLVVARADAGMLTPAAEDVDLADLVAECEARWRQPAAGRGAGIVMVVPPSARLRADAALLRQLLDNLVENAVRHSPAGGVVRITVQPRDDAWMLLVDDSGPGVPDDLRRRIFERFVRGDAGRSRQEGGAGLGLALCRAITEAHGGSVEVGRSDDGGARFEVILPRT
jgi:heavy metal sensor kinase